MPLMKLAATAIDRVAENAESVAATTATYAATDLLCYRAAEPEALVRRQTALWQPLLDWASLRFDAPLLVATGVAPIAQPADSLRALRRAVSAIDPLPLTAIADLTALAGSVVLALAAAERRVTGDEAVEIALLEETFQAERWGDDEEAATRRRRIRADIAAATRFLDLVAA
jgi:chaperone required for assembly of F1-ATPase